MPSAAWGQSRQCLLSRPRWVTCVSSKQAVLVEAPRICICLCGWKKGGGGGGWNLVYVPSGYMVLAHPSRKTVCVGDIKDCVGAMRTIGFFPCRLHQLKEVLHAPWYCTGLWEICLALS